MKKIIYTFLLISLNMFSQEKEKIVFLFNKASDTLIVKHDSEIYSIDKKHTFKFDGKKNEKIETKYDLIKSKKFESFSEFIRLNTGKKYPDYFNIYSFYIFIKDKNDIGCLIEVEKIWLVEDKIVD
ncbi:hypothetical protein N7U66_10535 [Lacinutrix neustonica]|uniref:Uncharacterized protein n=1 Tax=Lacinutrix neustonica TaxID=2980107 RepID=A0A9E8MY31_9FLAO|nr:hypothetical protein [Lacinutrix neustonica]WAC03808.1 hypothetical protein N7U66_10535 [Lacinutrix neustonica]